MLQIFEMRRKISEYGNIGSITDSANIWVIITNPFYQFLMAMFQHKGPVEKMFTVSYEKVPHSTCMSVS